MNGTLDTILIDSKAFYLNPTSSMLCLLLQKHEDPNFMIQYAAAVHACEWIIKTGNHNYFDLFLY